ncbi:tetratricopeptide repeat protein [Rasiella sp. SM2506]|uniref:type IX secretion system periplasmic lipoprotein PorW/SprE n=1 Tax=Rasiella sp. SM2506 TaxID=3423914 RepID=UPI003D7AE2D4
MSRNFHAVTAEYNTLYNGGLAYETGKEELALSYRDNFWEILPVERVALQEEIDTPGETKDPNFNRAEEKATKAIQKHSIYIDGNEYNPQIDEAYMMLGKARYFDQRFIPAQDAFNFILNRYPTSNNINRAKVWKAKTNIRLKNEDIALENLQEMMDEVALEDEELAEASAIIAQAYINLDSLPEALPFIKLASEYERNNELKGRYAYIKGQVYDRLEMRDSANLAYEEVIDLNRKSPRVYMINAYIAKARNFDYNKEDKIAFLELLTELEEDRENRPFLDKIYYQIGEYYRNNDSIDRAVAFYNKSIKNFKNDDYLQSMNYRTLAVFNFDAANYKAAGAYYDSTITNLAVNGREWRQFKKKRENLDDVITYEDISTQNDSILTLVAMNEGERLAYFTEYTALLREQARLDSIAAVKAQTAEANKEFYEKNTTTAKDNNGTSTFYFYNSTTAAFGKQEFNKIWGNRKLEDNWRLSSKKTTSITEPGNIVEVVEISESELFDPQTYITKIPTDQVVIDSLAKDRNFAYYQLGLIYKEKFREYELASNRLEKLLTLNPEVRLVLPSKYNLHKIYAEMGNVAMADTYKNDIITNHPDSRYAQILLNPNTQLATDESSPEFKYKALYREFENSQYQNVIDTSDEYITLYNGTDIVPKLEMLKATSLARKEGFEPYKKALNYIALNYPNSEEGKEAEKIYKFVLPKIANTDFVGDEESDNWKLIYQFPVAEGEAANALQKKLDEAIKEYNYFDMSTSVDYYNPETVFVIIHGLNTRMGGRGFAEVLKENKNYKIKRPFFEIASPNYKTIQIHKNLDSYLKQGTPDAEK